MSLFPALAQNSQKAYNCRMARKSKAELAWEAELEKRFLAAYDENADALYRHALVRVRESDRAKDIVQETFTKTWDYLSKGKEVEYLRAFLYRVCDNLIIDQARRKKSSSLDVLVDEDGFEVADESIREPLDTPAIKRAIASLGELDEMYRVVVTMRYLDGLSPKEISVALSLSENVVSVRIHRGIERLKQVINTPPKSA